jgi:hypothetical protein
MEPELRYDLYHAVQSQCLALRYAVPLAAHAEQCDRLGEGTFPALDNRTKWSPPKHADVLDLNQP